MKSSVVNWCPFKRISRTKWRSVKRYNLVNFFSFTYLISHCLQTKRRSFSNSLKWFVYTQCGFTTFKDETSYIDFDNGIFQQWKRKSLSKFPSDIFSVHSFNVWLRCFYISMSLLARVKTGLIDFNLLFNKS